MSNVDEESTHTSRTSGGSFDQERKWELCTMECINKEVYKYVQFINKDEDVEFGSKLQVIICNRIHVPSEYQQGFWRNWGAYAAVKSLKRKRQTLSNALCKRFERKRSSQSI